MEDETEFSELSDDDIREELNEYGITLHHKTGRAKLLSTLISARNGQDNNSTEDTAVEEDNVTEDEVAVTDESQVTVEASKEERDRSKLENLTPTEKAMRLIRVVVSPNDPNMASYPGLIFTVGSSKVNGGRMIKKYVPFNNDHGWHVPHIIYEQIEAAQMQKFRRVRAPNGETILQPYLTKKFNVQVLPPLTKAELKALADAQRARGDA